MAHKNLRNCVTKKRRYRDHEEAVNALHHFDNSRRRAVVDEVTTTNNAHRCYKCNFCKGWHLSSQVQYSLAA